jgi:hypothetical protein
VRLPSAGAPLPWAASGEILYTNIHAGAPQGRTLPYILGGHCVRPPSYEVLADYHRAGHLRDLGLAELRDLYRMEDIRWDDDDAAGFPGVHVLEGGKSLASPLPGTAGYARVFASQHPPYRPASSQVRSLAARYAQQTHAAATPQ